MTGVPELAKRFTDYNEEQFMSFQSFTMCLNLSLNLLSASCRQHPTPLFKQSKHLNSHCIINEQSLLVDLSWTSAACKSWPQGQIPVFHLNSDLLIDFSGVLHWSNWCCIYRYRLELFLNLPLSHKASHADQNCSFSLWPRMWIH